MATTLQAGPSISSKVVWLRTPRWDLTFIIFSVIIAALPYSFYLLVGGDALRDASIPGTSAYQARVLVNNLVALFIGGPHMYATFTRTIMDKEFLRKRLAFIASSILVPISVLVLAISSYDTYVWLLSIFFAMASVHALQQLIWLTGAYNRKARRPLFSRGSLIDYAVIFFSLYPVAVYRMALGTFKIGPVELKWSEFVRGQTWLAGVALLVFLICLALFIGKSIGEYRAGQLHGPKTLLIGVTVLLMFWAPAFPNLDTAFQGINTWHSFQYLALTWYANRLVEQRTGRRFGFMHWISRIAQRARDRAQAAGSTSLGAVRHYAAAACEAVSQIDRTTGWMSFYTVCLAMLPVSGLLIMTATNLWPNLHAGLPGADEAYAYIGVLSVLLVHYVHDALLFTDSTSIVAD